MNNNNPTPELQKLLDAEPDLLDLMLDYLFSDPALNAAVARICGDPGAKRDELDRAMRPLFAGDPTRVRTRSLTQRQQLAQQVLALFNGRNATEVARRLKISRASVYRFLKQPGGVKKPSQT